MNFKLSSKIAINAIHHNIYRSLSIQQNVNKSSSIILVNLNKNKKLVSSREYPQKFHHAQLPLYIHFQKRHISNESIVNKNSEILSNITDVLAPEDAVRSANWAVKYFEYISDLTIVRWAQQCLVQVHDVTGLPWWASIMLTGLVAKSAIAIPITITQIHNSAKLLSIRPEFEEAKKNILMQMKYNVERNGWPEGLAKREYRKKVKKEWDELIQRENCHPAKSFILMLLQIPVWISFSIGTRNLCCMFPQHDLSGINTYMELKNEGFGWVTNLTIPDQYIILPILFTMMNLSIYEAQMMFAYSSQDQVPRWKKYLFRGISVITFPIAIYMPAATVIYWLTSSSFGLLQTFMISSPRLKRSLGVPIAKPYDHPYQHFYSRLKSRLGLVNK